LRIEAARTEAVEGKGGDDAGDCKQRDAAGSRKSAPYAAERMEDLLLD
jgi:hypothetical protein